jgi:hypothetical protein
MAAQILPAVAKGEARLRVLALPRLSPLGWEICRF